MPSQLSVSQLSGYFLLCQSLYATVATVAAGVVNAVDAADGTDAAEAGDGYEKLMLVVHCYCCC